MGNLFLVPFVCVPTGVFISALHPHGWVGMQECALAVLEITQVVGESLLKNKKEIEE